jgi:Carboxypeptidase regulatory-like domain
MKHNFRAVSTTLLVLLCCVAPAWGQITVPKGGAADPFDDRFFHPTGADKTIEVRDSATGKGIAGASITVSQNSDSATSMFSAETGADGRASLALPGGKAKIDLTISAPGYGPMRKSWDASSGETVFTLTKGGAADAGPIPQAETFGTRQTDAPSQFPSAEQQPSGWQTYLSSALAALLFALVPLLAYFGLREVVVRAVVFFMNRRVSTRASTESAAAGTEIAGTAGAVETSPQQPVKFLEINTLNGLLLNGPAQERLERAESTGRRKLNALLYSFLLQVLGLAMSISLLAWRSPETAQVMLLGVGVLLGVDAVLMFYSVTTYLGGSRIVELLALLAALFVTTAAIAAIAAGVPFYLALIPPTLQVLALLASWRQMRQAARRDGNRKVLILRVFGSDKNAAFTFGNLMSQWRFVGSYLTIVDPAYIRHQFSVLSRANASRSLGTTLTIGTLAMVFNIASGYLPQFAPGLFPASWSMLSPDEQKVRIQAVATIVAAALAVIPLSFYIWRRFLKTPAQVAKPLGRVERAKLGLESDYPGSALYCFDDVWKPAVRKMLEVADVVLMDLRGFSEQRRGCAYEIGELMDRYPADRLLFLVDKETPMDLLRGLVQERWSKMAPESPNRKLGQNVIKIYQTSDRSQRDIQRIAGLLSASLEGSIQAEQNLALVAGTS